MKSKTERKLIKRESLKPKHHIDTCVIIESFCDTKLGSICKSYLNLTGIKYRGIFSLPMVGEFIIKVLTEAENDLKKELDFKYFYELIDKNKIKFYVAKNPALVVEIMKIDPKLSHTDASILACAIEDEAVLVTLDKNLIDSKSAIQKFNVKILSPKKLVTNLF